MRKQVENVSYINDNWEMTITYSWNWPYVLYSDSNSIGHPSMEFYLIQEKKNAYLVFSLEGISTVWDWGYQKEAMPGGPSSHWEPEVTRLKQEKWWGGV